MEQIIVRGFSKLNGIVDIDGAKNDVMPILAACLLAEDGITTLNNVPVLSDVIHMIKIMKGLNVNIDFNENINMIRVDATQPLNYEPDCEYVQTNRISILVLGPLLARNHRARVPLPGGCNIGKRPLDLHIKGLQTLGATATETEDYIEVKADLLIGRTVNLNFPSVGATQNIILAAVKANGTTIIENAAREPEIIDLCNFVNKMGALVTGAGTWKIRIEGVKTLSATDHTIIPDRIEAGTFMIAAAMTEGNILLNGAVVEHNVALIEVLTKMGVIIREEEKGLRVIGPKVIKATNVKTAPYPGFPTDLQAQISAIMSVAEGTSTVTDTIFENRFQHIKEMSLMNGDNEVYGNVAIVKGTQLIQGADVSATDLRAAAALVLLGLRAKGVTRVSNLEYLDRGYNNFHGKLKKIGAKLDRVKSEKII